MELKIENVKCKGFVKTLAAMLINLEGVGSVEVNHQESDVIFEINAEISKEKLIHQLVAPYLVKPGTANSPPPTKSCMSCVIEKLKFK